MSERHVGRRQFIKKTVGTFVKIGAFSAIAQRQAALAEDADKADHRPPNVVLIMVDDLGYYDLGCYGHPSIKTPVLDKLAANGIRLTSFYSGATVCTPSRMALLTGAYPARVGWTKGVIGYMIPTSTGLSPKALTMADVFKAKGYRTGIVGKWHIGERSPFLPPQQGFDESYYIKSSNNMSRDLLHGEVVVEKAARNNLLTEKFTREAIQFIKDSKDKPFFLYLPYTAPHFPVEANPDWKGKSAFGEYGDVVEELDSRIGDILTALKVAKLDPNTIVVFLSDNGPQKGQQAQAKPYRGLKWDALEGGTRVPCIIRWPGVLPAGQESDALIAAIDLLPTLSHACGIDIEAVSKGSPVIDGVNVWPTLLGRKDKPHPRKDLLYWHGAKGFYAIRVGDWKLFLDRRDADLEGPGEGSALFNLAEDVAETTDLSDKFPDRVREMRELAKKRLADINRSIIPLGE